jgi:tripartite-type tricarboxylate transporter receptor subunit TctC
VGARRDGQDLQRLTRPNTSEEFRAFVQDQMERWGKVVKEANIKLG